MSRTRILVPLAMLVAVMAVASTASAGGGGCHDPNRTEARGTTVDVGKNCFGPTVLRVAVDDIVTWKNYDPVVHTITFAGDVLDQEIKPEETVNFRFTSAGVYPYYCLIHPRMAGAVIVGDADRGVAAAAQPVGASPRSRTRGRAR